MPRSRGSEMPQQRQSPRVPLHLKTTSSESNGVQRQVVDRSPKLDDHHRRSPRSPLNEFPGSNQKKRGTKVADLETKLGNAQDELKKLKEQLATAEAAKRDAEQELEETRKLVPVISIPEEGLEDNHQDLTEEIHEGAQSSLTTEPVEESPTEENSIQVNCSEIDVVELVTSPATIVKPTAGQEYDKNSTEEVKEEKNCQNDEESTANTEEEYVEDPSCAKAEESKPVDIPRNPEVPDLEAKNVVEEKDLERLLAENERLKKQLAEAQANAASACVKEEELSLKLNRMGEKLEEANAKADQLAKQLEAAEGAKSAFEVEMKKMRVQTDQWRKAADAAAAVLSADGGGMGMEMNGRRVAERCGSMDKHLGGGVGIGYEANGGFAGLGSPLMDDGFGSGKRKSGGIRMFGDLWKKKGQQK